MTDGVQSNEPAEQRPAAEPAAGPQQAPPPQYGYQPQFVHAPTLPTNGSAVGSIVTSCTSLGVLMLSAGLLSPLTLIASIVGAVLGHKGKDDVDKGRAQSQRDLAVAGLWIGVAGIVLSVVALVAWVAVVVLLLSVDDSTWYEEFRDELQTELEAS